MSFLSMETPLHRYDAEMQRILFSDDPPLGELPIFEPIEDSAPSDGVDDTQFLYSSDPDFRAIEAAWQEGATDRASAGVHYLLQIGTDPRDMQMCLAGAARYGQEDLVQMLLSVGVPVCLGAVKAAIVQESTPLLSLFLQYGWNINEEEDWCIPPLLSFAISKRVSESLIPWFLSNGADPNATCQMDITPLSTAVVEAPYSVVEPLFLHCPTTTIFRGQLLHLAAARHLPEDYDAILRLVLERCLEGINARMYQDHCFSYEVRKVAGLGTPLHEAARVGRLSGVRILIAHGADASIRNSDGLTALEVAERNHNTAVADELRSLGTTTT